MVDGLPAVRRILASAFTLGAMLVLLAGSLLTSAFVSAGYVGPAIGHFFWLITIALIAALGMLAFFALGRTSRAVVWLFISPLFNYFWFYVQLALWLWEPVLMIPSLLFLNGLYLYLAWRFVLSSRQYPRRERYDFDETVEGFMKLEGLNLGDESGQAD